VSLLVTWRPLARLTRWGQAPSSTWLGDVVWVRRLYAVVEGTSDLGYRQVGTLVSFYSLYYHGVFLISRYETTHG
jgi:hypothetical protein